MPSYRKDDAPLDYAQISADLGNADYYAGVYSQDPNYYTKAVAAYGAAVEVYAGETDRTLWAQYQGELGNALLMLGGAADGDNATLQKAVAAYEAALTVVTRENDADGWARNQSNLANALTTLGFGGSFAVSGRRVERNRSFGGAGLVDRAALVAG